MFFILFYFYPNIMEEAIDCHLNQYIYIYIYSRKLMWENIGSCHVTL